MSETWKHGPDWDGTRMGPINFHVSILLWQILECSTQNGTELTTMILWAQYVKSSSSRIYSLEGTNLLRLTWDPLNDQLV